ncbi:GntR family transcriptional regulator [Streptococcus sp. 20-1249]|uniref:GntR family transcriptional regulator n=1 Tax=Streptococcus hepaticus TaxID=3349163 RepID=UPI0037484A9D
MFDSASETPLYLQLVEELEGKIQSEMAPNDKLYSERELTQIYGVSRITVRLAIQELERRGLIYKMHGKGTFVAEVQESALDLSSAYSFTEQMKKIGKIPKTKILSFVQIAASEQLAKQLQLDVGAPVYELERLRIADNQPMMLERSYVPVVMFEGMSQELLEHKPLYEVFADEYGQTVRLAEEEFYASIALETEAKWLAIDNGSPVLHLLRKTYNDKNRIIEYTFSIARADQFRYKVYHTRTE